MARTTRTTLPATQSQRIPILISAALAIYHQPALVMLLVQRSAAIYPSTTCLALPLNQSIRPSPLWLPSCAGICRALCRAAAATDLSTRYRGPPQSTQCTLKIPSAIEGVRATPLNRPHPGTTRALFYCQARIQASISPTLQGR
ncbi:hypothetical protein C8Q70DRAFT_405061 [Cubamyces menziesii]|nr:hypothetical protein C8Q70DRAFT_405061 [Cubamyces menziesii]